MSSRTNLSDSVVIETARSGHPILKRNGKYLASSVDPVREASAWIQKLALAPQSQVAVLGMGSGYHVCELLKAGHQVVTIEQDREVAEAALHIHADLRPADIIVAPEWLTLLENPRFRTLLQDVFKIAVHPASLQSNREYYANVEKLLLARDRTSFLLQLKMRPELYALLDPSEIAKIKEGEAISIKTVSRLFTPQANATEERQIWKILEELIV